MTTRTRAPRPPASRAYESEAAHLSSNAALRERVENQGSQLRSLAEDTSSQFRDFRAETSQQLNSLATQTSQQINSLSISIKEISAKFDASATRLAESQKPQYLGIIGAMIAAVSISITIIGVLSSLHDRPVDQQLATVTAAIADLTKNTSASFSDAAKATVSQAEYRLTTDFTNRISDLKTAAATDRSAKMQSQLDKLSDGLVSRAEHQFHWDAEAKKDDELRQGQVSLQSQINALAPASDMLRRLDAQQHELELRVYGVKPPQG